MKVQVKIVDIGYGWIGIIHDRESEEAEVADGRPFPTHREAREAAANQILRSGGFESGELVSDLALRLGYTHFALVKLIESSDYPVCINTAVRHGACWGTLPKREWTIDYLGENEDG